MEIYNIDHNEYPMDEEVYAWNCGSDNGIISSNFGATICKGNVPLKYEDELYLNPIPIPPTDDESYIIYYENPICICSYSLEAVNVLSDDIYFCCTREKCKQGDPTWCIH
ncbi:MAG: hypothetical protein PHZ07_01480 [Patescibacteria group bacterium]|nr:hypothetical protein [Patescibacteria group bacterium]MDD4303893.1 hypothetical protein [Patescibacteria group bacterium]MDD4695120.1 hypothetical protein [Patescibacteria group bacterium]